MASPLPGPYSGTSTLALVARASAFTFGLVYGNLKLKVLKVRRMTNKIRAFRQILKRWRRLKAGGPSEVPDGHVAVYVGNSRRRYVLLATYLNHPIFKRLLADAEDEFGFPAEGPLAIPCDESIFDDILAFVSCSTHQPLPQRCRHER